MTQARLIRFVLWILGCFCTVQVFAFTFHQDFEARMRQMPIRPSIFKTQLSSDERKALEFLYAYMPLPDYSDYSEEYYKSNVDCSLQARAEMPWGKLVPEREFYHFVLPIRVNNENLDESRMAFYKELKERVKHLPMREAALEVNHWCHEKVTYQPSDARTSSPLTSIRTAYGRCGEQSTFTVAALRAVGIPARQVYTPRWAHTDDNHAWVEVWIDGVWYFFGACEPAAVLNVAWFNAPASRGMLMHTKVFGNYDGPEEVMSRTASYTEINVTSHYAPVSLVEVKVVDAQQRTIADAHVDFKVYNYAEFYTVASKKSNAQGLVSLSAGRGDLLVWAYKDGRLGFTKCRVGTDAKVTVTLQDSRNYAGAQHLDVVPPMGANRTPEVTASQAAMNQMRLAYEDSVRNAYVSTFPKPEDIRTWAAAQGLPVEATEKLVVASRGNYEVIQEFLAQAGNRKDEAVKLLEVLAEKDLRDTPLTVLKDHFNETVSGDGSEIYFKYVMNPRISNEMLTPYKHFFKNVVSKREQADYAAHPEKWVQFCKKQVKLDASWNPQRLCMYPEGVWKMRLTDAHSRDIFFVAGARSMGIPARIDEVTGKTQYYHRQEWIDVDWEGNLNLKESPKGVLKLTYERTGRLDDPRYYSHFSLSKLEDCVPVLQNYPEDCTWKGTFERGTPVDAGTYMLVTGTRMADGSVLTTLRFFDVKANGETRIPLEMRENRDGVQVIGNFNSESLYYNLASQTEQSVLTTTGRGYFIVGLIAPNTEPTNHALRDIGLYARDLEIWGRPILLLFANEADQKRFDAATFKDLPSTVHYGIDTDGKIAKALVGDLKLTDASSRPLFIIGDTFNRVVFVSQGYTIGLGEQLIKVVHQLNP